MTEEQATQGVEEAIKNRVIAYCYKVLRDEEIRQMCEYVTFDKRLFQLLTELNLIPTRVH